MSNGQQAESWKRFVPIAQSTMVRTYKIVGLLALAGILLGLISFLTVNAFYLFDRTWIRPVVLSPSHEKVASANASLQREMTTRDELIHQRTELKAELGALDRTIESNQKFERAYASVVRDPAASPGDLPAMLARREVDKARLERLGAIDRRRAIENQIDTLDKAIQRYEALIVQLEKSPYIAATDREITVAFVPYSNLDNVAPGVDLYGCDLGLIWCGKVGEVVSILEGEVTNTHPQDGSSERGLMLEITLTDPEAAKERALFAGSKPFWIL